jgi:hypothetical protein
MVMAATSRLRKSPTGSRQLAAAMSNRLDAFVGGWSASIFGLSSGRRRGRGRRGRQRNCERIAAQTIISQRIACSLLLTPNTAAT